MANEKGLYWLALGVVALILVNVTEVGRQNWLGRLEDRSIELAEQLSGSTMSAVSFAGMRLGSQPYRCPRTQATAARMQAKLACMEVAMARQQAEFVRIQAERARLEALRQARFQLMQQRQDFVIAAPKLTSVSTEGTI